MATSAIESIEPDDFHGIRRRRMSGHPDAPTQAKWHVARPDQNCNNSHAPNHLAIRQWLEAADQHGMNPMLRENSETPPSHPPSQPITYPKAVGRKRAKGASDKPSKP